MFNLLKSSLRQRFAAFSHIIPFVGSCRRVFRLLIILVPVTWFGCTYTPEEDFIKEITPIDTTLFTISLNEFDNQDTIYLGGPARFNYNLGTGNGQLQEVRVLLGRYVVKELQQPPTSGSFDIYPSTGIFRLRVEFISTTGSGSLGDQAGGERLQVWKEWIIKAYVETPPEKPVITQSMENGYLTVRWTPYTRTKFIRYRFKAENSNTYHYFTDPTVTSWVDSTFTGYFTQRYWVDVETEVGTSSHGITVDGNGNLSVQTTFKLADSSITVTFPKPKYLGTFKEHTIKENDVVVGRITDPDITTYVFKTKDVGLNYSTVVRLSTLAKAPATINAHWTGSLNTTVPTLRFARVVEKFSYNKDLNSIMASVKTNGVTRLFRINPATLTFTDSVDLYQGPGYHVPYQGTYVYYSHPKELVQRDLISGTEQRINAITSTYGSGPDLIKGSDPRIVSYAWFGPASGTGVIFYSRIYDMANSKQLAFTSSSDINRVYAISEDGKFATLSNNKVYQVGPDYLTEVGVLSVTGTLIGFRPDKCEEILSVRGSTVYVYDANTVSQTRSIAAPASSSLVTYDVATKCLVFNNQTNRKIYSINIDTGEQREANINIASGFTVINGHLIINSRQYLKLF